MATRFYFSTNTPPAIPYAAAKAQDPDSQDTSEVQVGSLVLAPDASPLAFHKSTASDFGNIVCNGFFVSPRLAAQTLTAGGDMYGQLMFRNFGEESVVDTSTINVFVLSPDGTVKRVDATYLTPNDLSAPEPFPNNAVGRNHTVLDDTMADGVGPTTVETGDRLVVFVMFYEGSTGSTPASAGAAYGCVPSDNYASDLPDFDETFAGSFGARGWIEFQDDILFVTDTLIDSTQTISCSATVEGCIRENPPIYYHIYKAVDPMGPWEQFTTEPVKDNPFGNSYAITGLTNGQVYYIMVVGGRYDSVTGAFNPVCGQPIKNEADPGSKTLNPNIVAVRPKRVSSKTTVSLGVHFTLTSVGEL